MIEADDELLLSLLGLIMLAPAMLILAAAIRIDSKGQMVSDAEKLRSCVLLKLKNEPHVTLIMRLLQKYSVDELPQLTIVLRGEMSLVGRRAPISREVERYQLDVKFQQVVHSI